MKLKSSDGNFVVVNKWSWVLLDSFFIELNEFNETAWRQHYLFWTCSKLTQCFSQSWLSLLTWFPSWTWGRHQSLRPIRRTSSHSFIQWIWTLRLDYQLKFLLCMCSRLPVSLTPPLLPPSSQFFLLVCCTCAVDILVGNPIQSECPNSLYKTMRTGSPIGPSGCRLNQVISGKHGWK